MYHSYGLALQTALMQLVFWGIAGSVTFAPSLKQLGAEVIGSSSYGLSESPLEEDGESSSEPFDVLESPNRAGLIRRSHAGCSLSRHHRLSRIRIDQSEFFLRDVHSSSSRSELYLRNGCGATLRC